MDPYDARPWLKLYPPHVAPDPVVDYPDALTLFRAAVARAAVVSRRSTTSTRR